MIRIIKPGVITPSLLPSFPGASIRWISSRSSKSKIVHPERPSASESIPKIEIRGEKISTHPAGVKGGQTSESGSISSGRDTNHASWFSRINTGKITKISGGGVIAILALGITSAVFCENYPGWQICNELRETLGIKKK